MNYYVIRWGEKYALAKDINGQTVMLRHKDTEAIRTFDTLKEAELQRDAHNGATRLNCVTPDEFEKLTGHVPMTEQMLAALRALMVEGLTWREAANRNGVTESGILRAQNRLRKRNQRAA